MFRRAVAVVLIAMGLAGRLPVHAHVVYRHTGPIILAYSANDSLCRPLAASLNQTRWVHPEAIYVSEARTFVFKHAQLTAPTWVRSNEADLGNAFSGQDEGPAAGVDEFTREGLDYSDDLFFHTDVADEGLSRLVYLRNEQIGGHGDFGTEVWILKPGAHFNRISFASPITHEIRQEVDPDIVALKVDFIAPLWADKRYPNATVPERTTLPSSPVASIEAQALLLDSFRGSQTQAQEPFIFHGNLYFLAGTPLVSSGLVYRITPKMAAQVVCLTATRQTLNFVRSNPDWLVGYSKTN